MKLWVGLGNPGEKYAGTRHNAGAEILCRLHQRQYRENKKYRALLAEAEIANEKHYFMLPLTYMNLSGEAVAPFVRDKKIPLNDIIVLHDEIDLPPGEVKFKDGGGHRGHNGLRSIIALLGSNTFKRVRIGVGRPEDNHFAVADYVLSRPPADWQWPVERVKKVLAENNLPFF